MLKRYIGTFHVSTPDTEIAADITGRGERGGLDPAAIDRMVKLALGYHHDNRAEYDDVMGYHGLTGS